MIKAITGAIVPTAGTIVLEGQEYAKLNPIDAIDKGIAAIYQEFTLIPHLTVAENIYFGKEVAKGGFVDKKAMNASARALMDDMGITLDTAAYVCDLGIAYQQIVEIAKAVAANSKILIMDEPTAPLTNKETEMLFQIIEKLRARNVTIIYISHRMDEIFKVCDRVSVMRDASTSAKTIRRTLPCMISLRTSSAGSWARTIRSAPSPGRSGVGSGGPQIRKGA